MVNSAITFFSIIVTVSACATDTRIISQGGQSKEDLLSLMVYEGPYQKSPEDIFGRPMSIRSTLVERSIPCGRLEKIHYEQHEVVRCRNKSRSSCFDKFEVSKPVYTHKMTCCFGIGPEMIEMNDIACGFEKTAGGTDPVWDFPVKVLMDEYQAEQIIALRQGDPPLNIPVHSDCRGYWLEDARLRFGSLGFCRSSPLFVLEGL